MTTHQFSGVNSFSPPTLEARTGSPTAIGSRAMSPASAGSSKPTGTSRSAIDDCSIVSPGAMGLVAKGIGSVAVGLSSSHSDPPMMRAAAAHRAHGYGVNHNIGPNVYPLRSAL